MPKRIDTNDVYVLVNYFLTTVKDKGPKPDGRLTITEDYHGALIKDAAFLLAGDLTLEEIRTGIDKALKANPKELKSLVFNLSDCLTEAGISFKKEAPDFDPEEDLLLFGRFYYHPLLQVSSKPSRYVMNEDQTIEEIATEEFFLEVKPRFTMTELVDWFIEKTNNPYANPKAIRTQFKQILPVYGLDLVLYMIEEACPATPEDTKRAPRAPRFLEEELIIQNAKSLLYKRIEMLKEANIYGFIPRSSRIS